MNPTRQAATCGLALAAIILLSACSGAAVLPAPTATPALNPTVPPPTPSPPAPPALDDLPTLPDALSVTPGDRFSVQTTRSTPAQVETYYRAQLAALGLSLASREENAAGLLGRGLLLTFTDGERARVYVMILPEFEDDATGVLLTLDGDLLGGEQDVKEG